MSAVLPLPQEREQSGVDRAQACSIALWFFIGVACSLFGLFFAAYVMRLESAEGYPLALPWQFMLSSGLLAVGSAALELGRRGGAEPRPLRRWLLWGGLAALAFLLAQLWGWQDLAARRVLPGGNPAASFLYLLTAMHGLHVLGGLAGWWIAWRDTQAWRIALLARYWHFLLLLWAGLYATLGLLTPDLVRAICGTA